MEGVFYPLVFPVPPLNALETRFPQLGFSTDYGGGINTAASAF